MWSLAQGLELLRQFSELDGPQGGDVTRKGAEVVATVLVDDGYELQCCVPDIFCLETKEVMRRLEDQFEIPILWLQVSLDQCLEHDAEAKVDNLGIPALEPFDQLRGYVLLSVKSREEDFLRYVLQIWFIVLDFVQKIRGAGVSDLFNILSKLDEGVKAVQTFILRRQVLILDHPLDNGTILIERIFWISVHLILLL